MFYVQRTARQVERRLILFSRATPKPSLFHAHETTAHVPAAIAAASRFDRDHVSRAGPDKAGRVHELELPG
jgi:hypothetical protein